ncbi:MAG: DUF2752 domain-containing protein [Micrococcales bacterium]|nr:DUF2752 domain-containing protein [Micrococcales bacterium]
MSVDAPQDTQHTGLPARWFSLRWPAAAAACAGVGAVALLVRDPHSSGSWGYCWLHMMTGLYCPACGGLRGTSAMLHGNLAEAWTDNPFWFVVAPVLVAVWAVWTVQSWRGRRLSVKVPTWVWVAFGASFVLFGVVRNLPGFPLTPG